VPNHPPLQVVDENDAPIRGADLREVYDTGLLHRIVEVMVEDPSGRLLLQKRGAHAATKPLHWDYSVGGHVDADEDYLVAARREAEEELGINDFELTEIDYFRIDKKIDTFDLKRFIKVYRSVLPANTKFAPPPEEVTELRWFTVDEVKRMIEQGTEPVTHDLKRGISKYYS